MFNRLYKAMCYARRAGAGLLLNGVVRLSRITAFPKHPELRLYITFGNLGRSIYQLAVDCVEAN